MSSPATQVPTEEEQVFGEEGYGGARVSAGAVAAEEDGVEATPPARLTCCVCMEPWTCNDAHRICSIPCGHVYGRSCLERWLHRCGKSSAKCPQCGEPYALNNITNLSAPGNLWDGCCRTQELKAFFGSEMAKTQARLDSFEKRLGDATHVTQNVVMVVKTEFVSMKEKMERLIEHNATPLDLVRFMEQNCTKVWDRILEPPADG